MRRRQRIHNRSPRSTVEPVANDALGRAEGVERTMAALREAREPGDVLGLVTRSIARDFRRPCAAYDVRSGCLRPAAASHVGSATRVDDDLDLEALRHRGVVRTGDTDYVAIAFDGQLRAVLALKAAGGPLTDEDARHLKIIAAQASLALSTALAFEALRRYAAEGAALTDAARTLLGFNELEPLADALCRLGMRLGLATRAAFYARRGDRLARIGWLASGPAGAVPESLSLDLARARDELSVAVGNDGVVVSRMLLAADDDNRDHTGLLVLTRPQPFDRVDHRLCDALVTLAALAIRNVELYEQSMRASRALAESNAFKDDLMAMFAHDFKGPLTVISGFAELLLETDDAGVRRNAQKIFDQTRRLAKLSDDALALAATQSAGFSLQRAPEDMAAFVRACVTPLDRDGRIFVMAPDEPQMIAFDAMRLRHVLENVVGNALKYSTGAVRIEITRTQSYAGTDEAIRVEVSDHGIGVPPDDLARIFTRFGRAVNARSRGVAGSGVGLYIAKKIVEVHGGRLEVRSVENQGSTFSIVLPLG